MKLKYSGIVLLLFTAMNSSGQIRLYTGSYTHEGAPAKEPSGEGIGLFNFNPENCELESLGFSKQRNPSYLCFSEDYKYLLATEELPEGNGANICSYLVNDDGSLELIHSKNISGGYACHLAICKNHLLVANYMSGNVLVFEILENGKFSSCQQIINHFGSGPNKERQESSHMHMVYPWAEDKIFLVDLGLDIAQSYQFDSIKQKFIKEEKTCLNVDRGAGARHMVISKDTSLAFVLGELDGALYVFENLKGEFKQKQSISYIKEGAIVEPSGAAIRIHPNGLFLYASDRATNTLAIFKIDSVNKTLALVAHQDVYGECPRDFNIDSTGQWLFVANQDSHNLVVFKIDAKNGLLSKQNSFPVKSPVNVGFMYPELKN